VKKKPASAKAERSAEKRLGGGTSKVSFYAGRKKEEIAVIIIGEWGNLRRFRAFQYDLRGLGGRAKGGRVQILKPKERDYHQATIGRVHLA